MSMAKFQNQVAATAMGAGNFSSGAHHNTRQAKTTSFAPSVNNFMHPSQNSYGTSTFNKQMINVQTSFGLSPMNGAVGGLPEFADRGSLPTFFITKSGSMDKSPNSGFIHFGLQNSSLLNNINCNTPGLSHRQ